MQARVAVSIPGARHRLVSACKPVQGSERPRARRVGGRAESQAVAIEQAHPLVEWVHEQAGMVADSVRIQQSESTGQGLVTTAALAKGVDLVLLPEACQLTYSHAAGQRSSRAMPTSPALLRLIEEIPETFWGLRLALRVLEQRALASTSPFWCYISHLPPVVHGVPMFFSRTLSSCSRQCAVHSRLERKPLAYTLPISLGDGRAQDRSHRSWNHALRGTALSCCTRLQALGLMSYAVCTLRTCRRAVHKVCAHTADAVKSLWYQPLQAEVAKRGRFMAKFSQERLRPALAADDSPFNGVDIDLNGLGWALAVVTSRAFATGGPRKPRAMLPMIDMCNHTFDPNCDIRKNDDGSIALHTTRPIRAGQQLLLSYGKLDNHTLLLDYGFLVPDNPYDNIAILFDVDRIRRSAEASAHKLLEPQPWQKERLIELRLVGQGAQPACAMGRGTSAGPLAQGVDERLISGLQVLCAPEKASLKASSKLKPAVEAASLALAQLYIKATFEGLELDAVQDQMILARPELPNDMRIAIQHRLCKVVMLEEAYETLNAAASHAARRAGCDIGDSSAVFRAAMEKL